MGGPGRVQPLGTVKTGLDPVPLPLQVVAQHLAQVFLVFDYQDALVGHLFLPVFRPVMATLPVYILSGPFPNPDPSRDLQMAHRQRACVTLYPPA